MCRGDGCYYVGYGFLVLVALLIVLQGGIVAVLAFAGLMALLLIFTPIRVL